MVEKWELLRQRAWARRQWKFARMHDPKLRRGLNDGRGSTVEELEEGAIKVSELTALREVPQ